MYICTTSDMAFSLFSYCGAQIFEIYGLGQEVVDLAFTGSVSKISGLTFDEVRMIFFLITLIKSTLILRKCYLLSVGERDIVFLGKGLF